MAIPPQERRTGLLVPVDAGHAVATFRRRHLASAIARRLPPHVTILFPFARGEGVPERYGAALAEHFAGFPAFDAELTAVGVFADAVWLAPTPNDRFLDLIAGTTARFPEFPPYEGEQLDPVPHLTIGAPAGADDVAAVAAAARAALGPALPVGFRVDGVSLFEEQADGTFAASSRFPLR